MSEIPSRADVVVIGGGITGCSVLYHLAKAGCNDAILLERHQLTSGTTWHAAALVTVLRGSPTLATLAQYSAALYASLEAETGQSTGWRRPGHLTVAASKERMESLRHSASSARSFGLEVEMITASEVAAKWPLLRTEDLHGALWSPTSGRVDPSDTCQALVKGARRRGARIFENTAVTRFDIADGRIKGVRTAFGTIQCNTVVNCAGLWSREVGAMAGHAVPLYACEHLYMLTDPVAGVTADLPAVRDSDAYLYFREDVGGLLVGCFEPNPKPLPVERLPRDSGFVLMDEDWDHFEPMMKNAIHRIPALETAGMRSFINGPESFTLDSTPLIGQAPEVRGLFTACGMNSSGIVFGGGVGWAVTEWITRGRPPIDLWSTDVRRYSAGDNNLKALSERIPEVLAKHFEIPWPGHDYDTVRSVKRTPLHGELKARGAAFTQRAGWERPAWFSPDGQPAAPDQTYGRPSWFANWRAEHEAARDGVALFDQSPFSKLLLQGRDVAKFLQRLCANEVEVAPGKIVYTSLLNAEGGIESDLTLTRLRADAFLLVTGAQQGVRDTHWLTSNIGEGEHVALANVTSGSAVLGLAGPRSRELLARLTPQDMSNTAFPFGTAREIEIGYGRALALRVSYTGELGWELHVPAEFSVGVFEEIMAAGKAFGLRLAGTAAMGSLRLEKGFRSWGHDIGPTDTPLEAGLGFALRFDKAGGFIGRDALLRKREEGGRTRRLMSFVFDDPDIFAHHHEPIYRNGERCGSLSSASFGHSLGRTVALGWIKGGALADGAILEDRFEIEVAGRRHAATPHVKAPFDPQGSRMRS
ncbi:FAD-dependent oxidoreductase [Hypericibacter terrae]|uniref:FAD-dependent oxidoreductase n=1 Tax=Hypericibacter terrae TaxID=2602015 RepID=A0A5J6MDR9_9PROT|nr:FAD-dependent oxidoreductase [Hypericibacter terrae]QEX15568.1 FAD-dependent oxidoreductase [Hypericibacter terrae]